MRNIGGIEACGMMHSGQNDRKRSFLYKTTNKSKDNRKNVGKGVFLLEEAQRELLQLIRSSNEKIGQLSNEYWKEYSSFDTWQFWFVILMLVIPLIVLFWKIDRDKMLLLGFYGFSYHMLFAYTNSIGIRMALWEYPYEVLPILPSFALDASFVPVTFMLLYQWTLNKEKSFYLYGTIVSGIFAFIIKPILVNLDFFRMFKGVNYIGLFLFYITFFVVAKLITKLFVKFQENQ